MVSIAGCTFVFKVPTLIRKLLLLEGCKKGLITDPIFFNLESRVQRKDRICTSRTFKILSAPSRLADRLTAQQFLALSSHRV